MSRSSSDKKIISIFGVTGSVGKSTADVIEHYQDDYIVEVVTAHNNVQKLAQQAIRLKAKHAVIANPEHYQDLQKALSGTDITCAAGSQALCDAAEMDADWVMMAIVGMACIQPFMHALKADRVIATANKEILVAAGTLVLKKAKEVGTTILPVDSEHNAIFQLLGDKAQINKIVLTASGGPFRHWSQEKMQTATPEQAVKHPNWSMGQKISIDSASMMNKGLEIIEAHRLFDLSSSQIDVLVHPQSIIHGMVEYKDGSIGAILAPTDMKTPITMALDWPKRRKSPGKTLDLLALKELHFEPVDPERFPALSLAYQALEAGDNACLTLNAANEIAVEAFLAKEIGFLEIVDCVKSMVQECGDINFNTLDDIIERDRDVRFATKSYITSSIQKKAAS